MFEDDFLEFDYEDRNGSSDDFYTYNSRDFDESWEADELDPEFLPFMNQLELDLLESDI